MFILTIKEGGGGGEQSTWSGGHAHDANKRWTNRRLKSKPKEHL